MASLVEEFDRCATEQAAAVQTISTWCSVPNSAQATSALVAPDAAEHVQQARDSILSSAAKMQRLLDTPTAFLQRLARQVRHCPLPLQVHCTD